MHSISVKQRNRNLYSDQNATYKGRNSNNDIFRIFQRSDRNTLLQGGMVLYKLWIEKNLSKEYSTSKYSSPQLGLANSNADFNQQLLLLSNIKFRALLSQLSKMYQKEPSEQLLACFKVYNICNVFEFICSQEVKDILQGIGREIVSANTEITPESLKNIINKQIQDHIHSIGQSAFQNCIIKDIHLCTKLMVFSEELEVDKIKKTITQLIQDRFVHILHGVNDTEKLNKFFKGFSID